MEQDKAEPTQPRNRKRKRSPSDGPLREAYSNITVTPRPSSGLPGSPHRFFKSSYTVTLGLETDATERRGHTQSGDDDQPQNGAQEAKSNLAAPTPTTKQEKTIQQVVHQHANGLCVITAGEFVNSKGKILSVDICAKAAPDMSAAERRKRQSKMLKRKNFEEGTDDGIATPGGVLCHLDIGGVKRAIYGCVWGHILELNSRLTPELMQNDPLLDGYIAIVLPIGPFPPPTTPPKDLNADKESGKTGSCSAL